MMTKNRNFIYFVAILWLAATGQAQTKKVIVDFDRNLGSFKLLAGTNAGPIGLWSKEDYTPLFRSAGFRAIRTHDYYGAPDWYEIFPTWEADSNDPACYDFINADSVIRDIVDNGFDVLFRLGSSWRGRRAEYTNDPPGTIRNAGGQVTHAADSLDFVKFANICKHIVMHYNDGWANGFHFNIKRWEIWNEPSLEQQFWTGTPEQFQQMFATVATTLKAHDSSLLIGGPGLAGHHKNTYCEDLLAYCHDHQVPLDFFSWHSYGGRRENSSPWDLGKKAQTYRALLDQYGYIETASVCDEWNAGIGPGNYSDSGKGAAFYAAALVYFVKYDVAESYQYRGDDHPLGLVKSDGSVKRCAAALRAWKILSKGTHRLQTTGTDSSGFAAIASATSGGDTIRILIANFPNAHQNCSLRIDNLPRDRNDQWLVFRYVVDNIHRLEVVDTLRIDSSNPIELTLDIAPQSVDLIELCKLANPTDIEKHTLPRGFRLEQNFPNPFNPSTTICFSVPNNGPVSLNLYDVLGRKIETLVNGQLLWGTHSVTFNGRGIGNGVYVYQLQAGDRLLQRRMIFIK